MSLQELRNTVNDLSNTSCFYYNSYNLAVYNVPQKIINVSHSNAFLQFHDCSGFNNSL
jgi:hypothetical protein